MPSEEIKTPMQELIEHFRKINYNSSAIIAELYLEKEKQLLSEPVKPVEDETTQLKHDKYDFDKYNEEQLKNFLSTPETVNPVMQSDVEDEFINYLNKSISNYEYFKGDGRSGLSASGEKELSTLKDLRERYQSQQAKQPVMQWVKEIELMADTFKSDYALAENGYCKAIDDVVEYLSKKEL